jgi:hypothetical protein
MGTGPSRCVRGADGVFHGRYTGDRDGKPDWPVTRRYLSPLPVLGSRLATRLLLPPDGFSLVVERDAGLVAVTTVARYCDPSVVSRADLGLLVADEFQGQGIGTPPVCEPGSERATG